MTELFRIFGTIGLNGVDESNRQLDEVTNHGEKTQSKLSKAFGAIGKGAAVVGKAIGVGLAAGATGIIALGKQAVSAYGQYEQLVGGVETLFKDSADTVIANASRAYKTAGMSANAYMETVTSFSASLLQSLGGDTVKAAEKADMAITDMSDNANKMGTTMAMIQNAYNGFAKQNYTMLDNLKLGYGGTKTEMERLLKDARAISGIKYDISSYADIVDAIHVIQTEMGITGTTAKEASSTIQGSINSMRGAWRNLLTGLSDPTQDLNKLMNEFVDSIGTVGDNLIPRISGVLDGIVNLISKLAPRLVAEIPGILATLLPKIIEGAKGIVDAIVSTLPELVQAFLGILPSLIDAFTQIFNAIIAALPALMQTLVAALPTLIPQLVDALLSMVLTLIQYLPDIIQPIIDNLPEIIMSIVDAILQNLPIIITGLIEFVVRIASQVDKIIAAIIDAIPYIIEQIITTGWDLIPVVWSAISEMLKSLGDRTINSLQNMINLLLGVFVGLWNGIKNVFSNIGTFFTGLWGKIKDTFSKLGTSIGDAISNAVKSGINGIISQIEKTINKAIGLINGAIGVINKIPGVSIKNIAALKMPRLEKGGVLEKGQVGLLEGNGAEAVVPLEKNKKWLSALANDLNEIQGGSDTAYTIQRLIDMLASYFPQVLDRMEKDVVLDDGTLVGKIAPKMNVRLAEMQTANARGR